MSTISKSKGTPEERAANLLSAMGLDEKMAQIVCYFPKKFGEYDEFDRDYPNGAGFVSCLEFRNLETLEEAAAFQRGVQEKIMSRTNGIPAAFHMEGLCGAYLQGAASFPSGIGRASSWDTALEFEIGKIIGEQERAVGITHTFAPVLDIARDPRLGRFGETYGEDAELAAAMGAAMTRGLQAETTNGLSTEAVAKHFLGSHAVEGGIHGANCEITERRLREVYAKPFQAAVNAGLRGIMPCYCSINGEPVSASKYILTDILRGEMGVDGITVSDYCAISNLLDAQKLCGDYAKAGLRALMAGMDAELHFKKCFGEGLKAMFESGEADIAYLDNAVRRILAAKFRMGLFENPFSLTGEALKKAFYVKNAEDVSLQSARESLVLLKNDGVLPIGKGVKKIAVIGCFADNARFMLGGYSHLSMCEGVLAAVTTMAGFQGSNAEKVETLPGTPIEREDRAKFDALLTRQKPNCKNLLQELRTRLPGIEIAYSYGYDFAGTDCSRHGEALEAVKGADLAILTLGDKYSTGGVSSMGEGIDATDINLPICQETFISEAAKLGKPLVALHFSGRPISSDNADKFCSAVLECWTPAEKGAAAVVDALLGVFNPCGKLPVSVPYNAGQIPVYYGHYNGSAWHQGESIGFADYVDAPHRPRYSFGHGLSYAAFWYAGLRLNKRDFALAETVIICADITNSGAVAGTEVVQLYFSDKYASMTRPNMELAAFTRVALSPGETKTIELALELGKTAFLDESMRWKVEAGEFEIMLGSSSADIRLREEFTVTVDGFL